MGCEGHKPAALVISPELPYPPVGGGALRTASLLEWLGKHYEIHLVAFVETPDPDAAARVAGTAVRVVHQIPLLFHSKTMASRTLRNLDRYRRGIPPLNDRFAGFESELARVLQGRKYQLAVIEHFWCAGYLPVVSAVARRTVLNLHNIESSLHARCAASSRWPLMELHRRFSAASLDLETSWLPRFDHLLVTSEEDRRLAEAISPSSSVMVFPNAVPLVPLPEAEKRWEIVFSGTLDYHPNRAAVAWFGREVWPELKAGNPGLRWRIVGRNPQALAGFVREDPDIVLTGAVEDAVRTIAESQIGVVPILSGSGTRVKILEMWAAGLPVVSTTIGAEGLRVRAGEHLLLANSPGDFRAAICELLHSPDKREQLGCAGRVLYEQSYSWPAAWRRLEEQGDFLRPS